MKAIIVSFAMIFCHQTVFAQGTLAGVEGGLNADSPNFFLANLKNGQLVDLFNPDIYTGVEGSPFLSNDWAYARIKLADNRIFDSVLIKVNLFENKIHFKDNEGRERMVAIQVREITVKDALSKWNNYVFVSGYGADKNVFFQVLADGNKARLLKKMKVIIKETKVFNAPNQKSFELQEELFILLKENIYGESKNCSSLMRAFEYDIKVNTFISTNNLKCNKEKDLTKLVDYYNSY